MKLRQALLVIGLAASAAVAVFGDRTPEAEVAEAVPRAEQADVARTTPDAHKPAATVAISIAALRPRSELMGRGAGELFARQSFDPPPPPPPKEIPGPPPAPQAPPPPFTYLGKQLDNARWEVWLAVGDHTYIAREGSVIERDYVINRISPPNLTLTYLPLKQMQTMTIGGVD